MSDQHDLILVTGATGQQGGATARHLISAGHRIRALVRDPESTAAQRLAASGAELAVGDFDTPDSIAAAVAGVRAVFAVPPAPFGPRGWDDDLEAERGTRLVELSRRAGVDHFVFTGIGSFRGDVGRLSTGKKRIEDAVAASGMRYTLLRPVRFMENYLARTGLLDGIDNGVNRHAFAPDRPVQVIAVDDVGVLGALTLADPNRFDGRVLELAGDEVTPLDAVAAISRTTGHEVRYRQITEAEAAALPEPIATTVQKLMKTGSGWQADIPALREIHPGLHTFDTWLAETGAAQLKSMLDN
ncbi:NmrA family NAD(P)-binding protein [Nocardia wallacei]|uniref:NmrA family NAD(P)-binding protein n=1 Tax=Nocardia wallacei TaxID=480035 RepID=UPI002454A70A|nr:NmrA family NAD(P)-binding protein [Nocardia wallacei]